MHRVALVVALVATTAPALAQQQPQRPVDHGPFTAEANRAYRGGGVVLEGAPGAPPPPASDVLALPPEPNAPPR